MMRYEIDNVMLKSLLPAAVLAEDMLARLDERTARSPVGDGFAERGHFFDAAGALWVAGELVHVEDLVLHDAHMDSRTPSHELTIAHSVLRARRRIWTAEPGWALSAAGLNTLAGAGVDDAARAPEVKAVTRVLGRHGGRTRGAVVSGTRRDRRRARPLSALAGYASWQSCRSRTKNPRRNVPTIRSASSATTNGTRRSGLRIGAPSFCWQMSWLRHSPLPCSSRPGREPSR